MDGGGRDDLEMIQVDCIYCALYFLCYYISSTSDHQALDPGSLDNNVDTNVGFSLKSVFYLICVQHIIDG